MEWCVELVVNKDMKCKVSFEYIELSVVIVGVVLLDSAARGFLPFGVFCVWVFAFVPCVHSLCLAVFVFHIVFPSDYFGWVWRSGRRIEKILRLRLCCGIRMSGLS